MLEGVAALSNLGADHAITDVQAGAVKTSDKELRPLPRSHVWIIVQNLPVPLDRRVGLECPVLTESCYAVSVICPKGFRDPSHQVLDGVDLYKYGPTPPATGAFGYLLEFVYCWLRTALLSVRANLRQPIDVIQACNPTDTYWVLAVLWRWANKGQIRFVFDHHDLNPEVFRSHFRDPLNTAEPVTARSIRWLERRTFDTAVHMISTNDSYRRVAICRGGLEQRCTNSYEVDTTFNRSDPSGRYRNCALGVYDPLAGVEHPPVNRYDRTVQSTTGVASSLTSPSPENCDSSTRAVILELFRGNLFLFTASLCGLTW